MLFRLITAHDSAMFHQMVKKNVAHIRDYFPKTVTAAESATVAEEMIRALIEKARNNEVYTFLAEDEDGKLAGAFFIKEIDTTHSKCEIAYFVDKTFEGKGIASAGVSNMINYIFQTLQLNKIICRVATNNHSSNRVALKNDFTLEGVLRKEFRITSGRFVDINCFGLINPSQIKTNE
jgi:RimJ/RimL family protein N-acetyltransferase